MIAQILNVDRPHDFALVHGVDVVDLHADVADGVLAREGMRLGALERSHLPLGLGAHRKMHLARSEFAHYVDTGLEVLLLGAPGRSCSPEPSGAESKAEMKTAFGVSFGSAITP